jgi:hypothetical protein
MVVSQPADIQLAFQRIGPLFESELARQHGILTKQAATSVLSVKELRHLKSLAGADAVSDIVITLIVGAFTKSAQAKGLPFDEHFNLLISKSYRTDKGKNLHGRQSASYSPN